MICKECRSRRKRTSQRKGKHLIEELSEDISEALATLNRFESEYGWVDEAGRDIGELSRKLSEAKKKAHEMREKAVDGMYEDPYG